MNISTGMKKLFYLAMLLTAVAACSDNGPSLSPVDDRVIVAFGDSITYGRGSSDGNGYRKLLQDMLQGHGRNVYLVNEGIPGSDTRDGVNRIKDVLERNKPGLILILYGTNDEYQGLPKSSFKSLTYDNLRYMIETARDFGTTPVIATLPFACGSHAFMADDVRVMSQMIRELAIAEDVRLADVYRAFRLNGKCDLIGPSGNHPTDEGYRLIAQVFFDVIKDMSW